jgi:hypothetical protein
LTVALARIAREQVGCAIEVGELAWAGHSHDADPDDDVILLFAAQLLHPDQANRVELADPLGPDAAHIRPSALDYLAAHSDEARDPTHEGPVSQPDDPAAT